MYLCARHAAGMSEPLPNESAYSINPKDPFHRIRAGPPDSLGLNARIDSPFEFNMRSAIQTLTLYKCADMLIYGVKYYTEMSYIDNR